MASFRSRQIARGFARTGSGLALRAAPYGIAFLLIAGCRALNPAFEADSSSDESFDSSGAALSSVPAQSSATSEETHEPPPLETTPAESPSTASSPSAQGPGSDSPSGGETTSQLGTTTGTPPAGSQARSCAQIEYACFDMELQADDDGKDTRIADRGSQALILDAQEAQCSSDSTRSAPFEHECRLSNTTRIESIQPIQLPSSGGIGIELHSKDAGCVDGSRCLVARIKSVITLEYDRIGAFRCTLPKASANPLVVVLPQPDQAFVVACWQDGKKAFLQVRGETPADAEYPENIPLSSSAIILGGGNEVGGGGSHYSGALGLLRIWSNTDSLSAHMSESE